MASTVASLPERRSGFAGRGTSSPLRLPGSRTWDGGWGVWSVGGSRLEKEKEPSKNVVSSKSSLSPAGDSGT